MDTVNSNDDFIHETKAEYFTVNSYYTKFIMTAIEKKDNSKFVPHVENDALAGGILSSTHTQGPRLQCRHVGLTSCLGASPVPAESRAVTETVQMAGREEADINVIPLSLPLKEAPNGLLCPFRLVCPLPPEHLALKLQPDDAKLPLETFKDSLMAQGQKPKLWPCRVFT